MTDAEIRQVASSENRIVITKDSDFLDYYLLRGVPPKVLLLEFGNIRNKALFEQFEKQLFRIEQEFADGADLLIFNNNHISRY